MEMEKKNLAIIILAVALAASGIGNILFAVLGGFIEVTEPEELPTALIFGTASGPVDADPQYMWDSESFDYAYQIFEGLYAYNLSDPDVPLISKLATDFGTWDGYNHTISLRQDVDFHSGTHFNASSVKFTFDRLNFLCNFTGDQGQDDTAYGESIIAVLYSWPDGTPVLNRTIINSEYSVTFVLNREYGVWLPLLTFTASMMLDYELWEVDDYVCEGMSGATAETISGTGPFKLDYTIAGVETQYSRFDDYWQTPAQIEKLVITIIQDSDARNTAMLNRDVHILDAPNPSYYDEMRANKDIILYEAGPGTTTQYLGMNNNLYNFTWRSAISFAIDYDYLIDNIMEGEAVRLKSPIPLGIQFANWSYEVADYNITKAREYMVSMGHGSMAWTDSQWQAAEFLVMNYTYNIGNQVREDFFTVCENTLDLIGITLEYNGLEWDPYLDYLYGQEGYDQLSLWFIGWMPDYNDPSNYVNSLMSNVSSSNTAQINDPTLEAYMLAGLQETDQNVRQQIYWDLQKHAVENLRPWCYLYVGRNMDSYVKELHGYPSNGMGYNYFYPCYFA